MSMHRKKPKMDSVRLRVRLRVVVDDEIAFGPGRADLLEEIADLGSIVDAARNLGMSYMRAWKLVQDTNQWFNEPLVVTERGGRRGGGAVLTDTGARVLALYRSMENQALGATRSDWTVLRRMLNQ